MSAEHASDLAGDASTATYPLGAVSRLTGLSPDLLRAWERRYQVVTPLRTSGGTRRYQDADVERLRLVKAAVDAGHRISEVAALSADELERRAHQDEPAPSSALERVLTALEHLDNLEAERLTGLQLAALGPGRFARDFAAPLAEAMGEEWANHRLSVASEHLGTALLRSLLGASMRPSIASSQAPPIVFCTLPGERHELGLLIAALVAVGAGGNPLYLGPDLPVDEIIGAAELKRPVAVGLSVVFPPNPATESMLAEIRAGIAPECQLWVGGSGACELTMPEGVDRIGNLVDFEQRVALSSTRRR